VLNQTFTNFELIIVCDPSTDNSNAEVDKFTDSRIHVYHRNEPGPGGYAARNLGIEKAKAKWVAFLDADDEWYSQHLELAYKKSHIYQINVVCFSYEVFGAKKYQNRVRSICNEKDLVLSCLETINFLKDSDIFHTNAILIKKNVLKKSGFFPSGNNYKRGGDVDTWLRVVLSESKILFCPEVTSFYNFENSGVIANKANALSPQPLVDTVAKFLPLINDKSLKRNLQILSNRKSISLIYDLKCLKEFRRSELKKIHCRALNYKQVVRLVILVFFPISIYDYLSNK
jgi:glycosyltransferase involved in cell wall biosynthesis